LNFATHAIAASLSESETPPKAEPLAEMTPPASRVLPWIGHGKNIAFSLSGTCLLPFFITSLNKYTFDHPGIHKQSEGVFDKTNWLWYISGSIGLGLGVLETVLKRGKNLSSNPRLIQDIMLALPAANVISLTLPTISTDISQEQKETIFYVSSLVSGAAFLGSALWSIKSWHQGRQKSGNIDKTVPTRCN
jgi:hypothetical protein